MKATTDDVASARSPELSLSAGRIEVSVEGINFTGPRTPFRPQSATLVDKPIHEKAKKVVVLCILEISCSN